jgi:hypothetical protein
MFASRPFSKGSAVALLLFIFTVQSPVNAQQDPPAAEPAEGTQTTQGQVDELQRRLEILAAEVEKLRSGEDETIELSDERRRALGLAPSAAATYRRKDAGLSLAGYGEALLENFKRTNEAGGAGAPVTRFDFLRAVLYTGYRFNDKFLFNAEIEVEHASEIFVEFAYVDYAVNDNFSVRGGMLLVPLGLVNEFHEPTVSLGAKRPETEQRIIPSTWRENGAGVLGTFGPVNFRAYVVNGLNGAAFSSAGVRGGRQRGINARAANMAFAGRVDVTPVPGVFAGGGLYSGGSGQEGVTDATGAFADVDTTIAEVHGQAQWRGIDLRGLFAQANLDDAAVVTAQLRRTTPTAPPVAERMRGGYFQAGYNLLSQRSSEISLLPYLRFEQVDTQNRVPAGFARDLSRDGRFTALGVELKPIPNVVVKTEYQWITNEANTGRNQFNLNLGYAF